MKYQLLSLFAVLLFEVGCVHYVNVALPQVAPVEKIEAPVTVQISEDDLATTDWAYFGITEWFFPTGIKTGEILRQYSIEYLDALFKDLKINEDMKDRVSITLAIVNSSISAITGKACLEIEATVRSADKAKEFKKVYAADGCGRAPYSYGGVNYKLEQNLQIMKSTEEAFSVIFEEMKKDLKSITWLKG